jgi:hypothetical protein
MKKQITKPNEPATRKQTFYLFTLTKQDWRGKGLTVQQASDMIDKLLKEKNRDGAKKDYADSPSRLFDRAHAAGVAAGTKAVPVAMIVAEADGLSSRPKKGGQVWLAEEGACGFAWVVIKPARGAFVEWLKERKIGHKHYHGGYEYPVHDFNQSIARKEAYAHAFASVLRDAGLNAYPGSRLD